jgi:cytochrome c-type biogenesis protein CcmH/NrfF
MNRRRNDGRTECERRAFLGILAGGLFSFLPSFRPSVAVQDPLAGSGPAGKVADPASAGRAMAPTTAADTDAAYQAIEKQLKCSCGCGLDIYTCRTTDFNCTYSPGLHRQVVAMAEEGQTAQEIIDAFIAQYGQQVLMAPPKRGFNLAGYFVPSIVVLVAAGFLVAMLRRWTRAAAAEAAATPPVERGSVDASPAELDRLRRELERLPG